MPVTLTVTKNYTITNLLDDIRIMYEEAGPKGGKVTFLLTDAEIKTE
jgi:dynein heavy chain